PPAGRTGPARRECLTCALHCHPASEFPPALPVAVDKFRFAAVPRSLAHAASGIPVIRRRSSRLLPDSLCWPWLAVVPACNYLARRLLPSVVRSQPGVLLCASPPAFRSLAPRAS